MQPEKDYADYLLDQHLGGEESDFITDDDGNIINDTDSEISDDDVIMDQDGEIIGYLNQE
jgi:hypothetical protein